MSTAVPVPILPPAASPNPVLPRRRPWVSALILILKLSYAFLAGALAVWVVSFTPSPGPELTQFVPARAGVVVHIRSGATLLTDLSTSPTLLELIKDPDFSQMFAKIREQQSGHSNPTPTSSPDNSSPDKSSTISAQLSRQYTASLARTPKLLRAFLKRKFPPEISSLFPLAGKEIIFAKLVPELNPEQVEAHRKPAPQTLLITRVSGGPGMLVRMLSHFSKNSQTHLYDLGGDVIAIGFNGAAPGSGRTTPLEKELAADSMLGKPLARITVFPPILEGKLGDDADYTETPLAPYLQALTESVLQSLLRPPKVSDMLGLSETPHDIRIDIFETPGGLAARGEINGGVPALPTGIPDPSTEQRISIDTDPNTKPYLEGVLPVNAQACYLAFTASQLRPQEKEVDPAAQPPDPTLVKKPRGLSKAQRKAIEQIGYLQDHDIDLDTDFWPALGKAVHFRMDDPPPDLSPTGYGLLRLAAKFDGANETARHAAGELTHSFWDMFDGAPYRGVHTPYIRRFAASDHDCYVLATGEIFAPTWCVAPKSFSATSDAGSFALMRNGPQILPPPPAASFPPPPTAYFLKLDGRRIAPSIETYNSNHDSDLEKDLGSQAFLAKYPDAELHSAIARKLCGLLGNLFVEITPTSGGKGILKVDWKPGSVNVPSVKHDPAAPPHIGTLPDTTAPPPPPPEDAAPPPPPPDN